MSERVNGRARTSGRTCARTCVRLRARARTKIRSTGVDLISIRYLKERLQLNQSCEPGSSLLYFGHSSVVPSTSPGTGMLCVWHNAMFNAS